MKRIGVVLMLSPMMLGAAPLDEETVEIAVLCEVEHKLLGIRTSKGEAMWRGTEAPEPAIRRLLPDRAASIAISNSRRVPYRCVGGLIFTLQRLGYSRIGFISEPSPR